LDQKLLEWGLRRRRACGMPRLWLFTDERRLRDPRAAVAALPRGRAGVVLRHDGDPERAALGRDLARLCRMRRLVLVVAGDVRLAAVLRAGVHLRGGMWPGVLRVGGAVTSSAHSVREVRRARRAGAGLIFLSPAFATASHVGAPGLGALRWAAMARCGGVAGLGESTAGNGGPGGWSLGVSAPGGRSADVAALGGVDGRSVRRLPVRLCRAAGAIGALA
jgi:thiamine-phosphate pyrophosphorylase